MASQAMKDKVKKSMEYSVQDFIDLEKAISNTAPDVNEIILHIICEFMDDYATFGDEDLLDAKIAQQEIDRDIATKLSTKTSEIIGVARDNNDIDSAIAVLTAAKT
jgi:hypothetical protein